MATTDKIGEAAALLNLKTYVLRFWETEFPAITPLRTEKGQRLYTEENLALLERIRFLLHERGLTIEGARKVLNEDKEKGVSYVFTAGAVTAEEPARDNGPAPEEAAEAAEESAEIAEEPAAIEDEDAFDTPDGSNRALSAAGTAVKKFLSQYNLPGISKSYPIHEKPLFERPEHLHEADRPQERPAPCPVRREEDEEPRPTRTAFGGESLPSRDRSAARTLLRDLTAELEDIARLLRANSRHP